MSADLMHYLRHRNDVPLLTEEILGKPGTASHKAAYLRKMKQLEDDGNKKAAGTYRASIIKHYGEVALNEAKQHPNKHVQTINQKSWTVGCADCGHADEHRQDAKPKSCPACGNGDIDVQLNEDVEQLDERTIYKVHRSINHPNDGRGENVSTDSSGQQWGHHSGDVYHSLDKAKDVAANMKKGATRGTRTKITAHPVEPLTGPRRKLPEETSLMDDLREGFGSAEEIYELLEDYAALLGQIRALEEQVIDENVDRRLIIKKAEGLGTTDERDAVVQKQYDKIKLATPKTPEEWNSYQAKLSRNLRAQRGKQQKSDASKADDLARARLGGKKSILDLS